MSHVIPKTTCHSCGHAKDRAKGDEVPPVPGDYSVCAYCGALMIFGEDLVLRKPTSKELMDARNDEELWADVTRARQALQVLYKNNNRLQ